MQDEQTFTLQEAKKMGEVYINQQKEILRKRLRGENEFEDDDKVFSFEEAEIHMKKFIKNQGKILEQNLREKRRNNTMEYA